MATVFMHLIKFIKKKMKLSLPEYAVIVLIMLHKNPRLLMIPLQKKLITPTTIPITITTRSQKTRLSIIVVVLMTNH